MVVRMILISPHRDLAIVKTGGRYYKLSMYEEINDNHIVKHEKLEIYYRLGYTPASVIFPSVEVAWEYLYNKYKKHQVDENPKIANTRIADSLHEKYQQKR